MILKRILQLLSVVVTLLVYSLSFGGVPVDIETGKGTVITLKKASKKISISDPAVADISLISPTEVMVSGKAAGATTLVIWDADGVANFFDIRVMSRKCGDTASLEGRIKEIAPGSDVKAECDGNTLVLRGTVKNRFTCKRDKESLMTRRDEKQPAQSVDAQDKDICIETISKIEQIARFYSSSVLNLVTVPEADQVILEVKVAEIDKTKLSQLGIGFLAKETHFELTAPGLIASPSGTISGSPGIGGFDIQSTTPQIGISDFPSGIGAILRAISTKGYGKVLAEPNLVVRSGESGRFVVGTRIPIQTVTGTGGAQSVSITYEEVGIKLNFLPQVLESGAIRLRINPAEVSSVTGYVTFQGIVAPQIDTRTVNTSVDLKEGESLVLAGLLTDEMKKNLQKVPILGDIPILGALFRYSQDELVKKELAFFITPRLVKPIPAGEKKALPAERQLTPEEEREFNWVPVPAGQAKSE